MCTSIMADVGVPAAVPHTWHVGLPLSQCLTPLFMYYFPPPIIALLSTEAAPAKSRRLNPPTPALFVLLGLCSLQQSDVGVGGRMMDKDEADEIGRGGGNAVMQVMQYKFTLTLAAICKR